MFICVLVCVYRGQYTEIFSSVLHYDIFLVNLFMVLRFKLSVYMYMLCHEEVYWKKQLKLKPDNKKNYPFHLFP